MASMAPTAGQHDNNYAPSIVINFTIILPLVADIVKCDLSKIVLIFKSHWVKMMYEEPCFFLKTRRVADHG